MTPEQHQEREAKGFGQGLLADGRRAIELRVRPGTAVPDFRTLGHILPTTLDLIVHHIMQKKGLKYADAFAVAVEYLESQEVSSLPVADIGSRLHAALAMTIRGPSPRKPSVGDMGDIDHLASFLPYADIFIADAFIVSVCNRSDIRIGDKYGTKIRTLGGSDIDDFVKEIDQLRATCPHVSLVNRIHECIQAGGYIQERTEALAGRMGKWK